MHASNEIFMIMSSDFEYEKIQMKPRSKTILNTISYCTYKLINFLHQKKKLVWTFGAVWILSPNVVKQAKLNS